MEKHYKSICKQIKGAKQSILYDINKKFEELKNTIALNETPGIINNNKKQRDALGIKLPIKEHEDFLTFETVLENDSERESSLVKKGLLKFFKLLRLDN